MKKPETTPEFLAKVRTAVSKTDFFADLHEKQRDQVMEKAGVFEIYDSGETIVRVGEKSDSLFVIVEGEIGVIVGEGEDAIEITRLGTSQTVGEIGILLDEVRTATCMAATATTIMKINRDVFHKILTAIPDAGLSMMRVLATRLKNTSRPPAHREFGKDAAIPPVEVLRLLPIAFMQRHRIIPLRVDGAKLLLGYCDVLDENEREAVSRMLPSMKIEPVPIDTAYFNKVQQGYAGENAPETQTAEERGSGIKHIDDVLQRLVGEGGSDLHLSAGQIPRWRIHGDMKTINGFWKLAREEVFQLLEPIMRPDLRESFKRENDADFAYAMDKHSRFRINLLRDHMGVSAVFRHIPNTIFSLEELGMPDILRRFCDFPKGLVLVTGPTGSGKSTTLAAMIDYINRKEAVHILTIEDPIEFVHESKKALVNHREVGVHTRSFARALKAALREDPDIVLVGEMRDLETISMALETANTGHLVLATLHTSTAMGTVDRIVDLFPADSQNQIRSVLADNLIGVCCQTLCRKIGGGRIPALEILVMDYAMSNMIREGKTHMLPNAMVTGQAKGNRLLNDDLARLVTQKKISPEEAVSNSPDKRELEKRLGLKPSM